MTDFEKASAPGDQPPAQPGSAPAQPPASGWHEPPVMSGPAHAPLPDWHEPLPPDAGPGGGPGSSAEPGRRPAGYGGAAGYDPYGASHPGGYAPAGYVPGTRPESGGQSRPAGRGRALGGALAAAAAFLGKFGFLIFKLGKIGPTAISMVVSLAIYTWIFGWWFAVGFVLLIFIHEMGHVIFARMEGLRVTLPIFLGPFGAAIRMKEQPKDQRQEAVVAIGGPVFGTFAAAGCFFLGLDVASGHTRDLLLALSYTGFFLNLFNLMPINPLDGGRVANAVTKWANVVGLAVIGLILYGFLVSGRTPSPLLIIILVIGAISTYQRFKAAGRHEGPPPVPARTRAFIGGAYLGMLAFAALGMTISGEQGLRRDGTYGQVAVATAPAYAGGAPVGGVGGTPRHTGEGNDIEFAKSSKSVS